MRIPSVEFPRRTVLDFQADRKISRENLIAYNWYAIIVAICRGENEPVEEVLKSNETVPARGMLRLMAPLSRGEHFRPA